MGIRVDLSTVLLLFAPLFLPRVYGMVAQAIARMANKAEAAPTTRTTLRQRPAQAIPTSMTRITALPAALVAVYSLYLVTHGKPFNFFSSLGLPLPLIAPTSKIQAALNFRNLQGKYEDDLALLTSLDVRALYLHFGHDNLIGCHRLLDSVAPKDVLVYTSIRLARGYLVRAMLLAYANRRWKNSIFLGTVAGFLYELYTLATTDMRLPQRDAAIISLWDFLSLYRNIGFMVASVVAIVLPSKQPAKPLSTEEGSLVQAIQALIQRQDMLQTRIRVIEAATSPRVKKESSTTGSQLSSVQKDSLKAWLRTIVEDGSAQAKPVPTVKIEEADLEPVSMPVKTEEVEVELPSQALPLPKSESLDFVEESFATAQVIIKRSSSAESLSSPALSRSSSSSSPIDTPTPAMRRPTSMEITGANAAYLRDLIDDDGKDAGGDAEDEADQPLHKRYSLTNRLTQSLGPSGPVSHPNVLPSIGISEEKQHRRSFSMYGVIPGIRESGQAASESTKSEEAPKDQSDTIISTTSTEDRIDETAIISAQNSEGNTVQHQAQAEEPIMHLKADASARRDSTGSTPTLSQVDDDGWTTVYNKKAKNRT
ncbi:hypothetical protein P389DRAFT_94231 [Cystobasidium minutum MCA 4210]|uniref:uncharacterized protein n=1 Tax=Cystobasidium minutum MCA 4210 TaxID=1397322 RepID=UPI0034CE2406|eukprot:jgi/Rhomi1/94231/CE94230_661